MRPPETDKEKAHRHHQHMVTMAVIAAFTGTILLESHAPDWAWISHYFNLTACLFWIWLE